MTEAPLRQALAEACQAMAARGLARASSGNASVRVDADCFLATPSGAALGSLRPEDLALVRMDARWSGPVRPTSEWRFHRDILAARPEIGAVLHAHSPFATTLACLGREIPPFHYMVAVLGGETVRCAPYATFGTQALSDHVIRALEGRFACLMANHGMIAIGRDLGHALKVVEELELLSQIYWQTLQAGMPVLLEPDEMARVKVLFETYGTPDFPDPELVRVEWI